MSYIVDLVHYLAWPVVVLMAANMFREPLGQLIVTFADRASRISVAMVRSSWHSCRRRRYRPW
jgi:hypothetical protein